MDRGFDQDCEQDFGYHGVCSRYCRGIDFGGSIVEIAAGTRGFIAAFNIHTPVLSIAGAFWPSETLTEPACSGAAQGSGAGLAARDGQHGRTGRRWDDPRGMRWSREQARNQQKKWRTVVRHFSFNAKVSRSFPL